MEYADGPRPMRDMKPANKTPNCADQFNQDHQAAYESRGREASRVDWVQRHSNACPKMREELDKRRSIAQCRHEELSKEGKK